MSMTVMAAPYDELTHDLHEATDYPLDAIAKALTTLAEQGASAVTAEHVLMYGARHQLTTQLAIRVWQNQRSAA